MPIQLTAIGSPARSWVPPYSACLSLRLVCGRGIVFHGGLGIRSEVQDMGLWFDISGPGGLKDVYD